MSILELVCHRHYWSIPHRREDDNCIIQTCYDCGKDRESPVRVDGTRRTDLNRTTQRQGGLRLPWRGAKRRTAKQPT